MKKLIIPFILGIIGLGATYTSTLNTPIVAPEPATFGTASFSGAVISTSSTTNGPSANELATAGWVRNLLVTGQILYNSGDTNASGFDNPTYAYVSTIPTNGSRTYLSAVCTNLAYIGSVMTTNTYTSISGDVVVSPYICAINGTPSSGYTMHAEIYYTYDKTNLLGDWESGVESIYHGVTNKYSFVVPVPQYTATNSTGFYLVRRLKINIKTGSDDIMLHYGTNFPSSISIPTQSGSSGGANWVADGSTNSTLSGTATANSFVAPSVNFGTVLLTAMGIGSRSSITHSGGNIILDLSATNRYWSCTVTGNCSIIITNASAGNWGNILLRNSQSTNCTPTWTFVPSGSTTNWFGGQPTTFTAGTLGSLSFFPIDSTTNSTLAAYTETQ